MKRNVLLKIAAVILLIQAGCDFSTGSQSTGIAFGMLSAYFWFHRNWVKGKST
jgi:hypothetical protein